MSEFLKGNYKVDVEIESSKQCEKTNAELLAESYRKAAMNSIGGSMVYVEDTDQVWDGD